MPIDNRYKYGEFDLPIYERGYGDATRNINELLKSIILRAGSPEEIMVDLTGFILGNEIIFSGGTAQDAIDIAGALSDTLLGV